MREVLRENCQPVRIIVGRGEGRVRYILVYNPQEARRDRQKRADLLRRLRQELRALPANAAAGQALLSHPAYRRYLSVDRHGRPFIDPAKVREEARYDGKYLVRTSDDALAPEDVALGYKQLLEVEEAFRTLKHTLDIRPVHHRREERIRAHVLLCWLALLLVRVVELRTGQQWPRVRQILQRMHLGTFVGPSGQVRQRTEVTADQHRLFTALRVPEPPRIFHITTTPSQKKVP